MQKKLDDYINEAKSKNAGADSRVLISDYRVAGGARINGTLGGFTIIFNGFIYWYQKSRSWEFLGTMSFFDIWDFDSHRGKKTQRTESAEQQVEFVNKWIVGTPFNLSSVMVGVRDSQFREEADWFGTAGWMFTDETNKRNKGDLK